MSSRLKLFFKLRIEEFLAIILFIPMIFFMIIFHDKEGFRESNIDRFLITGLVFLLFLGIIKLKDLEVLKRSKMGRFIKMILDFLRETLPFAFCISIYTNMHDMVHLVNPNDVDNKLIVLDDYTPGKFDGVVKLTEEIKMKKNYDLHILNNDKDRGYAILKKIVS